MFFLVVMIALEALALWSLRFSVGVAGYIILFAFLAVGSAALGAFLVVVGRVRKAYIASTLGAAVVIGAALWFSHLWLRLQIEAGRAVVFAYEEKVRTGSFPAGPEGYEFRDALLAPRIQEFSGTDDQFRLRYYVAHPSVSYWYDSRGGWGYYPD